MAAKGLGRGLEAMIPKATLQEDKVLESEIKKDKNARETMVKISMVEPNRKQPRKNFDEDALQELSESIKQYGLIEPILVQDRKDHYEIIAGERRWRASRMAGLKEIPVIIRDYTEQQIVEISLIENIQREDLNPIEEAQAYKRLLEEFNLTQDQVAEKVSKKRSTVANSMRLLKLCKEVQDMVISEMISEGHARTLISIEDSKAQYELAQKVFDEKLSVRETEKLVKAYGKPVKEKPQANKDLDVFYQDIAEQLKASLGTKVNVTGKGNGAGKIEIEFYSNEELDRLTAKLK